MKQTRTGHLLKVLPANTDCQRTRTTIGPEEGTLTLWVEERRRADRVVPEARRRSDSAPVCGRGCGEPVSLGAFNLRRLLRHLVEVGSPRSWQGRSASVLRVLLCPTRVLRPMLPVHMPARAHAALLNPRPTVLFPPTPERPFAGPAI